MRIEILRMADYPEVYALWQNTEGVGLSGADAPEAIARYLERNPGMSFVARAEAGAPEGAAPEAGAPEAGAPEAGAVVGAVLAGHDGRRGFLHHLAVRADCRGLGVGRALVERALAALAAEGIEKSHIFVYRENAGGRAFWERLGWEERKTLVLYSK